MRSTSSLFGGADASFVPTWGDFAGGLSKNPPGRKASSILCFEYANPSAYWFVRTQVKVVHFSSSQRGGWKSLTFTITSASNLPFDRDMSRNVETSAPTTIESRFTRNRRQIGCHQKRRLKNVVWISIIILTTSFVYYIRRQGDPASYTLKKKKKRKGKISR